MRVNQVGEVVQPRAGKLVNFSSMRTVHVSVDSWNGS